MAASFASSGSQASCRGVERRDDDTTMMVCRSCSGEDDRLFRYMAVSHLFPVSYVHTSLFGDPCESACLSVSV